MIRIFSLPGFLIFVIFFSFLQPAKAQISEGGIPPSFTIKGIPDKFQEYLLATPDYQQLKAEDAIESEKGNPYRIGIAIPFAVNLQNAGTWTNFPTGGKIWRMKIMVKEARALGLYFSKFHLPEGAKFFIYDDEHNQVKGAYTSANSSENGLFAVEYLTGTAITLELYQPNITGDPPELEIDNVAYFYRGVETIKSEKSSDPCEVNINCKEGDGWQNQKRGVVRILIRKNGSYYWCTGSLVNNTRNDATPYVLTADHCGESASATDLSQWIFYFNFEYEDCANQASTPVSQSLTGAVRIAHGGNSGSTGSDFYLVLLDNDIPVQYNPYFNGWSILAQPSVNGVCIHHPAGDVKKISTYTQPLLSAEWMNNGLQSHWEVGWNETANGHGVTEGGSSGSPLLDSYGRIVGTLTGGLSSCNSPNEKDYFGMFPYHWASNGTTDDQQLKPWLDPDNTGVSYLDGISNNPNAVYAEFTADADTIPVGGSIRFTDYSVGNISTYNWLFEGGYPISFSGKEPPSVTYDTIGVFNTTLTVANEFYTHNKTLSVFVAPKVYPNPFSDYTFHIVMGKLSSDDNVNISLYDPYGRAVKFYAVDENNGKKIVLNQCISGVYMLRVEKNGHTNALKIVCAR